LTYLLMGDPVGFPPERLERPTSYGGHVMRAPEFASVSCYLSIVIYWPRPRCTSRGGLYGACLASMLPAARRGHYCYVSIRQVTTGSWSGFLTAGYFF